MLLRWCWSGPKAEQNRQELLERHAIKDATGTGAVLDATDLCAGLDPDLVSDGVLFLGRSLSASWASGTNHR